MLDERSRQADFPSLERITYLNTAAEGIPPLAVRAALDRYFRDKQLGMDGRTEHFAQWDAARKLAAGLLGMEPEEVGICSCASEAFNLAALALRLQPGDEVVINDLDFPAGSTPWLHGACPATVKVWRARQWALRTEDLVPLLGPRTRLVSTSLVSFFNGFTIPLAEVARAVRRHSPALLALDVTQALGRIPLERLADVDLVVSSTHKWILASHGGGIVGVPAARVSEWTVPAGGWFNLQDAFGESRLDRAIAKPGAAGFMVGMPNFPALYAIRAALEYLGGIGIGAIHEAAQPLVLACLEGLARLPIELITPAEPDALAGIIAFRHPKAEAIHARLHERGIHVMSHAGRLRISLHGYNTFADVDRLLDLLRQALAEV